MEPRSGCDDCFIATAAFGTRMAGKIDVLRKFRDRVLLPDVRGRKLVKLYYEVSPPVADFIEKTAWRRALVRILLLPVIGILFLCS